MNQSTTTQSKSRFRPVKVAANGLPGGPLSADVPTQRPVQHPSPRPAIIRKVVNPGFGSQPAKVVLTRQDEMSQPKPRMMPQERLQQYVQSLEASSTSEQVAPLRVVAPEPLQSTSEIEIPAVDMGMADRDQFSNSFVTWTNPQARQAINLSEATLIRPKVKYHSHPAHSNPKPHLQGWPEKTAPNVDAQLERATEIDEQLKQLELRIEKLSEKEAAKEAAKSESEQSIREQKILANPNTGELVAAISTAIVSALQEKSESEVLPQAKSLFEKRLQQHAVTLGELSDSVAAPEPIGSEAMFLSIAAQRQQKQASVTISDKPSSTALLEKLRMRIADYQRTMTSQTATDAANLVKQRESAPSIIEPIAVVESQSVAADSTPSAPVDSSVAEESPLVQFTAPEDASIPLKAASWDVEDFRWSSLTNQMLVGGGAAIKNLLDVSLSRTAAKTKRVVVAGAGRGQGATTIATALARAGNQAGYKTLLIDADVASPQLSQTVGLSAKISWLKGIGNDLPLGEVVIRSKKTNLCLMPLSATVNRVTWPRFIFDNLGEMLVKAESYFDLIVIDAGPASQLLDELSNPEELLDAMVMVDATAKLKDIEVYQNRLQTFGIDNLVLAENRKPGSAADAA